VRRFALLGWQHNAERAAAAGAGGGGAEPVQRLVIGALSVARALAPLEPLEQPRDRHDGRLEAV
jgi:hypothetical protein